MGRSDTPGNRGADLPTLKGSSKRSIRSGIIALAKGNAPEADGNVPWEDGNASWADGNVSWEDRNVPWEDSNISWANGNVSWEDGNLMLANRFRDGRSRPGAGAAGDNPQRPASTAPAARSGSILMPAGALFAAGALRGRRCSPTAALQRAAHRIVRPVAPASKGCTMAVLPKSRLARIEFLEYHVPIWSNDPAAIGLDPLVLTELNGLMVAARAAYTTQQTAHQTALASTTAFHNATDEMSAAASAAIAEIKAFAKTTEDPNVYVLAEIPPPASPQPAPPPAAPTNITTGLEPTGAVSLAWKITQPAPGAEIVTLIHRRLGNTGPFALLAVTGDKKFVDDTVPPGTQQATYLLQARRGADLGPYSPSVNVFLGVPTDGEGGQGGLSIAA